MRHLPISTVCFSDDSIQALLSNAYDARILTRATWSSSYERYGGRMFFSCAHEWYAPSRILLHCSPNLSISHSFCLLCHISHTHVSSRTRERVDNRHPDTTRARASSRVSESSGMARLQCSGAWRHKRYSRASLGSHEQVERHGTPPCLSVNS
jgi:hypothetical protein